jgi:hypothetical protein
LQEGPWWRRIQKEARLQQLQQLQFSMQEKESYELGVNINNFNFNNGSGPGSTEPSSKKNHPREHRFSVSLRHFSFADILHLINMLLL